MIKQITEIIKLSKIPQCFKKAFILQRKVN